ncbi:uncharacterized protein dlgap2a isoform X2 [Eucyclogobius newberryi]
MKGLSGGRPLQLQLSSPTPHTCGLAECDHALDYHLHHGDSRPPSYLLSPTESCPLDGHRRCSPRSSIHSDCMVMPVSMSATDHSISSSTFPRMHYGSTTRDGTSNNRDSKDETGSTHGGSGKMNRIPANLLDQFEKQMPLHRDGFHTLQYQRTSTTTTTTEQRNESPGRIRHLVHSVQKLFTKSHSLEGSSKMNGTKSDSHRDGSHHHHHHHHKHSKRSKSKDRKSESSGKQRSGGWWSSDDNLDSDSTYRTPSIMSRHHMDHINHCYPDSVHGHLAGDMSLKMSKSNNDVKCSAYESINMAPEGKFMKRSSWSTLTVSQAKEAYRKSSLNLEKPMTPMDLKTSLRPCHFLQVPQDEWGGYPGGGKDDEIPCRRMRSSSYVKAMGDEESGESDSSPKTSPQKSVRPDALVKALIRPRDLLNSQSSYRLDKINSDMRNYITNFAADLSQNYHLQTRDIHPSIGLDPSTNYNSPKFRSRNQSYMRAVSTLSQASCVSQVSQVSETEINGQFESVFSEVESQAMEALDLPGCFRTRSHSYLRAIQAGYSQDDDCIPPITSTLTSTIRSTTDRKYMQEESCLSNRPSVHEKLPDTAPLAHDDLGCPIKRDIPSRVYPPDTMGATAKPVSGLPVSPSLFRSPRSSAPECSPKAIQASIKESATLAAAISLQWKEEVSAMRRELAELRRDLCKELRAFNSNFNTFTQHYNTWSPQAAHMTVRAGPSLGGGLVGGQSFGTATATGASTGTESAAEKPRPSEIERPTLGAREKQLLVSKVSVGTQARSKVLVRQSTADAAVNCPDEKEERKSGRKGLPKQLSMDPSILASPQSMFVESAIPLDPILPSTVRTFKPKKVEMTIKPAKARAEPGSKLSEEAVVKSPERRDVLESITQSTMLSSSVGSSESMTDTLEHEETEAPKLELSDDTASDESKETIVLLPYPVPMVTVSPPDDSEVNSDSESLAPLPVDPSDPVTVTTQSSSADQSPVNPEPKTCDSPPPPYPGPSEVTVTESKGGIFITCPSILVSEHFDPEPPESPTDSKPGQLPIVNIPELIISSPPTSEPTSQSSSRQPSYEEDPKDSEWPPLPEPLATTPIYQSDIVHFDLVMLTSLDQDDLDSVFMDPEPEPLDYSDSLSTSEDPPFYQSDSPTSPLPTVDPDALCPQSELPYLDPSMEYNLDDLPQNFQVPLPVVTVTVSPPSSVSRDSSMDFGTPDPPCSPDLVAESEDMLAKSQESLSISQESGSVIKEETASNPERSVEETCFWYRWDKRAHRDEPVRRSASVELWSGRYDYNSAEITYVSLTL